MKKQTPDQPQVRPAMAARRLKKVPRSILVVDDNPDIRRLNTEVLINSGYHVDAVEDGESAFQALKMIRYDLVVTDNEMRGGSGIDLLKKLHASEKAVPVIMATGTFSGGEFERSPWIKPSVVLLKPYSIGELLRAVQKVLAKLGGASADLSNAVANAAGLSLINSFEPGLPVVIPIRNLTISLPEEPENENSATSGDSSENRPSQSLRKIHPSLTISSPHGHGVG